MEVTNIAQFIMAAMSNTTKMVEYAVVPIGDHGLRKSNPDPEKFTHFFIAMIEWEGGDYSVPVYFCNILGVGETVPVMEYGVHMMIGNNKDPELFYDIFDKFTGRVW